VVDHEYARRSPGAAIQDDARRKGPTAPASRSGLEGRLSGHRHVNPDIARALRDEERAVFKDLKQTLNREIAIRPDVQLHHEQFDLMAIG